MDSVASAFDGPEIATILGQARLKTSSKKHLEEINSLHMAPLMYKILRSQSKKWITLRFRNMWRFIRRQQLKTNTSQKQAYFSTIRVTDVSGFFDQEEMNIKLNYSQTSKWNIINRPVVSNRR